VALIQVDDLVGNSDLRLYTSKGESLIVDIERRIEGHVLVWGLGFFPLLFPCGYCKPMVWSLIKLYHYHSISTCTH